MVGCNSIQQLANMIIRGKVYILKKKVQNGTSIQSLKSTLSALSFLNIPVKL